MDNREIHDLLLIVGYGLEKSMKRNLKLASDVTVLTSRGHVGDGNVVDRILKANLELSRAYLEIRAEKAIYELLCEREGEHIDIVD